MTHPVFGVHEENVEYVTRYGVYAVIPDEKKEKIFEMFYTGADKIADSRRSLVKWKKEKTS